MQSPTQLAEYCANRNPLAFMYCSKSTTFALGVTEQLLFSITVVVTDLQPKGSICQLGRHPWPNGHRQGRRPAEGAAEGAAGGQGGRAEVLLDG